MDWLNCDSRPDVRSNNPPGAPGSGGTSAVISARVNPGATSELALAVHHDESSSPSDLAAAL